MERIENRTFDEIEPGDVANLVRTLTYKDIEVFAILSGDQSHACRRILRQERHVPQRGGAWHVERGADLRGTRN